MDTQQTIVDALTRISDRQTINHTEVVQRLTALETQMAPIVLLPPRVTALESWRGKVTGAFAIVSAIGSAILSWLMRRH